jgi:hypothetical protein
VTDDIAAFIKARIADDEAAALATLDVNVRAAMKRGTPPPRWVQEGATIRDDGTARTPAVRVGHTWAHEAAHIALHDPARVLREVAALRAWAEWHEPGDDGKSCSACMIGESDIYGQQYLDYPCPQLRHLATIWGDHRDYKESWTP